MADRASLSEELTAQEIHDAIHGSHPFRPVLVHANPPFEDYRLGQHGQFQPNVSYASYGSIVPPPTETPELRDDLGSPGSDAPYRGLTGTFDPYSSRGWVPSFPPTPASAEATYGYRYATADLGYFAPPPPPLHLAAHWQQATYPPSPTYQTAPYHPQTFPALPSPLPVLPSYSGFAPYPPYPITAQKSPNSSAGSTLPSGTVAPSGWPSEAQPQAYQRLPPLLSSAAEPSQDPAEVAIPAERVSRGKSQKRTTRDVQVDCQSCGKPFARLIKRGFLEELEQAHSFAFTCIDCTINQTSLHGLAAQDEPSAGTSQTKRGRSNDQSGSLSVCDVCHKNIGTGGCVMSDPEVEQGFTIEVVCHSCNGRYKRCTDCGAGGGKRLGVGKWRAKELFEGSRKTCKLPHHRAISFSEVENVVCEVSELVAEELPHVVESCRRVYEQNVLSNMAIPEVMESNDAVASFPLSTFARVQEMASGAWPRTATYLTDVQFVPNATRYLAVKWCKPRSRKSGTSFLTAPIVKTQGPTIQLRPGKEFVSFGIAEYEYEKGVLFVPVMAPYTNTDGFEPTMDLLAHLLDRVDADIEANLQEGANVPRLTHVFTMVPFTKDSRIRNYMEKKRHFRPLAQYLEENSDASAELFPPHRATHIPPPAQRAFEVLVKRYDPVRDRAKQKPAPTSRSARS